jgi:cysteine synthase A
MAGALHKVEILKSRSDNLIEIRQFENPANVEAHQLTTATEIIEDTDGNVDAVVAGVGTGGTVTGVGRGLKKLNPDVKIVAVEPFESPVLSGGNPGPHKIQGIGAGFVPKVFGEDVIDEILQIRGDEAIDTSRLLGRKEGLLVGISSGAAAAGALMLAKRPENKGKTIVALLPDTGERYLSTVLYQYPTDTH